MPMVGTKNKFGLGQPKNMGSAPKIYLLICHIGPSEGFLALKVIIELQFYPIPSSSSRTRLVVVFDL